MSIQPFNRGFSSPLRAPRLGTPRKAFSVVELLVAMAIAGILFVSVLVAFTQILRASDHAEALVNANNQARATLLYLARDVSAVRRDASTPQQSFLLEARYKTYGDGIDNDGDARVDEEQLDGRDDDSDWNLGDDRHAQIGSYMERADFIAYPDLGDLHVDEDCKFGDSRLTLRIPPDPLGGDARDETIIYELGTYDGQNNVLLRTVIANPDSTNPTTTVEPLAFNVLGFDVLAWNSNSDSTDSSGRSIPYWTSIWNANLRLFPLSKPFNAPDGIPPLEFPTSILAAVTVYSGRVNFAKSGWTPGNPIETLTLSTTIDLEVTLKDIRYEKYER